jgi:hypothetical protein
MDNREQAKQKYVNAAMISRKALAAGDHKTANRQARILNGIEKKMWEGSIDKEILVELLSHEYIGVGATAAADLLRLGYEIKRAEETLERIAAMDDTDKAVDERLTVNSAKWGLRRWRTERSLD